MSLATIYLEFPGTAVVLLALQTIEMSQKVSYFGLQTTFPDCFPQGSPLCRLLFNEDLVREV